MSRLLQTLSTGFLFTLSAHGSEQAFIQSQERFITQYQQSLSQNRYQYKYRYEISHGKGIRLDHNAVQTGKSSHFKNSSAFRISSKKR